VSSFRATPIRSEFDLSQFDCGGDESLNDYLKNEALIAHQRGASRTHVWLSDNMVVGYYTLIPLTVTSRDIPNHMRCGFNVGVPGFVIGKLALDRSL